MTVAAVLHVTESHGGGVASAIFSYVRSTPSVTHHLLAATREDTQSKEAASAPFRTRHHLPRRPIAAIRAIRAATKSTGCSILHVHSSWAGLFARVALVGLPEVRVVYTPHCFAFERRDIPAWARAAIWAVEWLLCFNTDVIAACSPRESSLARRLGRTSVTYVPNVPDAETEVAPRRPAPKPSLVAVGRLSAQKDPRFFAKVAEALQGDAIRDISWIGGGDDSYRAELESAGVMVTGWLPRSAALSHLSHSALYLHTAQWEGFPQTILEASARRIPIIARRIHALDGCPEEWMAVSADGVAALVASVLTGGPEVVKRNVDAWAVALSSHTTTHQRQSLLCSYGLASDPAYGMESEMTE